MKIITDSVSGVWSLLYRQVYAPLCRAYARRVLGDKPADDLMAFLCGLYFLKVHGYRPRFKSPSSFLEKVWSRMLYDRNPRLTGLADKLRARDHVTSRAGKEYLVPLFWTEARPEDIPFAELPPKFVLKTNHGCGYNIMIKDRSELDPDAVRRQPREWLDVNFCEDNFLGVEWAYKHIRPMIMVESLLEGDGGDLDDCKFFCYDGRAEFLKLTFDRFGESSEAFLDRDLGRLDFYGQGLRQFQGPITLPENYGEMVRVAEAVSQGIDFLRVDMYSTGGRIFVGELTLYHGAGMIRLCPRRYDYLLGEKWQMSISRP